MGAAELQVLSRQPVSVLLLEDCAEDAELVQRELARAGLEISTRRVATRLEYQRALAARVPDVVIADNRLPDLDGRMAVRMARAASADVAIMIVSGTLSDEEAVELIGLGADDFVLKDRMRRLGPAVAHALREAEERRWRQRQGIELGRSQGDLERFSHIAAHELQEPLRAVLGCTQLLARRYAGKDASGDELISLVRTAVNRMRTTLEELEKYVSISCGSAQARIADLGQVYAAAMSGLAPRIQQSGAIVTHGPLPSLKVCPEQIALVFQALVGHALDRAGAGVPHVDVSAGRKGGEWIFSVQDDCTPPDPAAAEKMFVLLQCGQDAGRDGGTSLPVARRIAEAHGGRMWMEPGLVGGRICFALPASSSNPDRFPGPGPVA